jgi:chromosomal replication initiation ATPase DnaA
MYLLKEHTDLTLKEIGQHFNISGFSVSMNANYVKKNKRMMGIVKRINELLKKG